MRLGSGRLSPPAALLAATTTCVLAALLLAGSASAAITFTRSSVVVGDGPTNLVREHVAVGDVNGDGDDDLVSPRPVSGTVSVLLGQPGGAFGARRDIVTGGAPFSAAVADFNGDGDLDLAVTHASLSGPFDDAVSVLLGRGDGSFGSSRELQVGDEPLAVAVGDFNRDGDPDLVTANGASDDVSVLLGTAGGGFGSKRDFPAGDLPESVAVGDFDDDDDPDLAIANSASDSVSVLLGRAGGGHFGLKRDFVVGQAPISVAVGDFNGDGVRDLATANVSDVDVSVLAGQAAGGFVPKLSFGTGGQPTSIAVGDFNQDGDGDLVVAETATNEASVFINTSRPVADVSPASLSFPTTEIGSTSARQDVTVKNTGDGGLAITAAAIEGGDADQFAIAGQTCTSDRVRPGQSCTISLRFRPTANGAASSTLRITDNAADSPQRVPLSGAGGQPPAPAFSVAPASLPFGNQKTGTTSAAKRVTVTNAGAGDLRVDSTALGGADPAQFAIAADTCAGQMLAAGADCTVDVTFKPAGSGRKAASLAFAGNAPGSPHTVALTGRGTGICLPLLCL